MGRRLCPSAFNGARGGRADADRPCQRKRGRSPFSAILLSGQGVCTTSPTYSGRVERITIAYDILSNTRKTNTRPLRSSGSRTVPVAATPVLVGPLLVLESEVASSGTTGTGLE